MVKLKIIIFGLNDDGKRFIQQLKPLQWLNMVEVVAIMDNDTRLIGGQIDNIEIINPLRVKEYDFDYLIILPIFYDEIANQLKELGVDEKKIVPYYSNYKDFIDITLREGNNLKVGRYSYYKPSTQLWNCEVGNFCHIGGNCLIGLIGHDPTQVTTYPLRYHFSNEIADVTNDKTANKNKLDKTKLLNDVYIGDGVVIMGGVTLGNGSIIGSRALVTKSVPDYSIVGGVPAKVIKKRFSDRNIEALLRIKWWDWSDEKIKRNLSTFEKDIEKFVSIHSH